MAVIPTDTPLKEDNEGFVKAADTPNKSEISKHIEVQVAQETRNVSTGKWPQFLPQLLSGKDHVGMKRYILGVLLL